METMFEVRLRHVNGDLSLGKMALDATVDDIALRAFDSWPEDGPLASHKPTKASEIRLISGGRFLDGQRSLEDVMKVYASKTYDTVVTMHVVIRTEKQKKSSNAKSSMKVEEAPRACASFCVIS